MSRQFHERYNPQARLSEIATMQFVRTSGLYPDIVVPQVHTWEVAFTNPVGAPYILMDFHSRSTAWCSLERWGQISGHSCNVRNTAGSCPMLQSALSVLVPFDKIGSITLDDEGKFVVGPLFTVSGTTLEKEHVHSVYPNRCNLFPTVLEVLLYHISSAVPFFIAVTDYSSSSTIVWRFRLQCPGRRKRFNVRYENARTWVSISYLIITPSSWPGYTDPCAAMKTAAAIPIPQGYDLSDEENLSSPFLKRIDCERTIVSGRTKRLSTGNLLRIVAAANNSRQGKQAHLAGISGGSTRAQMCRTFSSSKLGKILRSCWIRLLLALTLIWRHPILTARRICSILVTLTSGIRQGVSFRTTYYWCSRASCILRFCSSVYPPFSFSRFSFT